MSSKLPSFVSSELQRAKEAENQDVADATISIGQTKNHTVILKARAQRTEGLFRISILVFHADKWTKSAKEKILGISHKKAIDIAKIIYKIKIDIDPTDAYEKMILLKGEQVGLLHAFDVI